MNMKTAVMLLCAVVLLAPASGHAAGREGEATTYVIRKGDTLWGLSERFLHDPRYWPAMWAENGEITNPHQIFPGQTVRIQPGRTGPAATDQPLQPEKPVAAREEPVADAVAERTYTVLGNEGFFMETGMKPSGSIIGTHYDRVIMGDDDMVYTDIGKSSGVKGGEKFAIYRQEGTVSHPVTNEIMGARVVPLGILQLTDLEKDSSRAIITRAYQEITPGAFLMPYRDEPRKEVALKMPTRDLRGYIVESYNGGAFVAAGDVVYTDLGTNRGVEEGNMLYIVREVPVDQKLVEGRVDRMPPELIGALVILEAGRKTSMAIVVKSIDAISKHDRIMSLTK